jgi:hypothetical protein
VSTAFCQHSAPYAPIWCGGVGSLESLSTFKFLALLLFGKIAKAANSLSPWQPCLAVGCLFCTLVFNGLHGAALALLASRPGRLSLGDLMVKL